jgi:hypothetical protein
MSESCTTGSTPDPIEVTVRKRVHALWPKLKKILTTSQSIELFIAELRATAERSIAVNNAAMTSAQESRVAEAGVNEELGDRVPLIFPGMTSKANRREHENRTLVSTQYPDAEPSLRESTLAPLAHFSSYFLRQSNGGNTFNHEQRSRARARQRSIRRREELTYELSI